MWDKIMEHRDSMELTGNIIYYKQLNVILGCVWKGVYPRWHFMRENGYILMECIQRLYPLVN